MNAVRIRRRIESETLHVPELRPMNGREVEIIVLDEAELAATKLPEPKVQRPLNDLRSALPGDPFGENFERTLRAWRDEPWTRRIDEEEK